MLSSVEPQYAPIHKAREHILCRYDTCPTQYAPNFMVTVAHCVGKIHKRHFVNGSIVWPYRAVYHDHANRGLNTHNMLRYLEIDRVSNNS